METKVILCCAKPTKGLDKLVTKEYLENHFSKFGKIKIVKIFEAKIIVIKAFIEFDEIESARRAVVESNDIPIDLGCLRAYPSKKKTVVKSVPMKKNSQETKDEGLHIQSDHQLNASLRTRMEGFVSDFERNHLNNNHELNHQFATLKDQNHNFIPNFLKDKTKSLTAFIQTSQKSNYFLTRQQPTLSQQFLLKIGRKTFENAELLPFCNLFGYFGAVNKITIFYQEVFLFIEYVHPMDLEKIARSLHKIHFLGENLEISICNQSIKNEQARMSRNSLKKVYTLKNSHHQRSISSPSRCLDTLPSKILQIKGIPKTLSSYLFEVLLSEIHQPISFYKARSTKKVSTMQIIAEFASVSHAIEVLSHYQFQKIDNSKLIITFFDEKEQKKNLI